MESGVDSAGIGCFVEHPTVGHRGMSGIVSARNKLGAALYRVPDGVRQVLPRGLRDRIRRSVGPFAPWEAGFDHTPPRPGPGEQPAPPDFVGIGAQRAGTTWWFDLLVDHPGVFHRPGVHKELHYFSRFTTDQFDQSSIDTYHQWFSRPSGCLCGEWTPDYMTQSWVAPLLDAAAPETHLLVILRDPVERFISGVVHSEMGALSHEGLLFADAVERGMYARALASWRKAIVSGRLLVLQYERCVSDPAGELARTYRFLGLDDAHIPRDLTVPKSPTPESARVELSPDARRRLVQLYRDDVEELASLLPDLDVSLWPNFR